MWPPADQWWCLPYLPSALGIADKIFMGGRLRPQIDLMSVLEKSGEIGDTTETERVFGSPRIDFDEWLTAHYNANTSL